jgi:hypothetical protein
MAPRGQDKQKRTRRKASPQELAKKATTREKKKNTAEQKKKLETEAKKKVALASWKSRFWQATNEDAEDCGEGGKGDDETKNDANAVDVQDVVDDEAMEDSVMEEDCARGANKEMANEEMADEYNDFVCLDDEEDLIPAEGLMKLVLVHLQSRLQKETTGDSKEILPIDRWLSRHLQQNDFWILKSSLKKIAKKFGILSHFDDGYYLRDIKVWLPDLQWGLEAMPCCPTCESNIAVRPHCWRDNHFGRRVCDLGTHYFAMSRRYICRTCQAQADDLADDEHYTFMGWNRKSLELLPFGYGDEFPAHLTWKGGVDKQILDLMRPLFNKGFRPESFSRTMLELHSKAWTRAYRRRELDLARDKRLDPTLPAKVGKFSSFGDPSKYAGMVPTGRYLQSVYVNYFESIEQFYELEVKKRGARRINLDCHFKEAKHLGKYHGLKLWAGLVTVTNEYDEIRSQFHVTSESHEQIRPPLEAMLATMTAYGQDLPEIATTDKPAIDKEFLLELVPSLQAKQHYFDALLDIETTDSVEMNDAANAVDDNAGYCTVGADDYIVVSTPEEINLRVDTIRDLCEATQQGEKTVYAIDAEWVTDLITGKHSKISLIQLAGYDGGERKRGLLMRFRTSRKLPSRLRALFEDENAVFIGVKVNGDLKNIGRDFKCASLMHKVCKRSIELGMMARRRDVVPSGNVGMKELVSVVLNQQLRKEDSDRFSNWERRELTTQQVHYATLDVTKPLEIYEKLLLMPDLNDRLMQSDAREVGKEVDIVPGSGSVQIMASRAAIGRLVDDNFWELPGGTVKKIDQAKQCMVMVEKVVATSLAIPRLQEKGLKLSIGHFGEPPFKVALPIRMVKAHVESQAIQVFQSNQVLADPSLPCQVSDNQEDIEEIHDENEDPDHSASLAAEAIRLTDDALLAASLGKEIESVDDSAVKLDPPPSRIDNKALAVLGDGFHNMDRPKVSVHHDYKKPYFYALMEALYCWDSKLLGGVKAVLREDGMSDEEIASMMYFNADYFKACVPRVILPPTRLYWRLRAVFSLFGPLRDPKSGKPLFNDEAWKKARNLLKEVVQGLISDPPGIAFYNPKYNAKGEIMVNRHGTPLLQCSRSTSTLESMHKQLCDSFSTWTTGCKMAHCLLGEFRHRYTHNMSERRRPGFPRIGHYDTWLIDELQNLVLENHGTRIFSSWTNTCEFLPTPEKFGTVALQSKDLTDRVNNIQIDETLKLSPELEFQRKSSGTKLPFTPVHFKDEKKLFSRLALGQSVYINEYEMALKWCDFVDGITIFPKSPGQLREYRKRFERNRRIKDALARIKSGTHALRRINDATDMATDVEERQATGQGNSAEFAPELDDLLLPNDARPPGTALTLNTFPVGPSWGFQERTVADANFQASLRASDCFGRRLHSVGNMLLMPKLPALASISNKESIRKKYGRGPCKFRRKQARCMACVKAGQPDNDARACPGSQPKRRSGCPRYHKDGNTKDT